MNEYFLDRTLSKSTVLKAPASVSIFDRLVLFIVVFLFPTKRKQTKHCRRIQLRTYKKQKKKDRLPYPNKNKQSDYSSQGKTVVLVAFTSPGLKQSILFIIFLLFLTKRKKTKKRDTDNTTQNQER